jgi:hypothetical protein
MKRLPVDRIIFKIDENPGVIMIAKFIPEFLIAGTSKCYMILPVAIKMTCKKSGHKIPIEQGVFFRSNMQNHLQPSVTNSIIAFSVTTEPGFWGVKSVDTGCGIP